MSTKATRRGGREVGVTAPQFAPRGEIEEPVLNVDKLARSPLGMYMKATGTSLTAFARAMGVKFITAQRWAYGEAMPDIIYAFEIERITKGQVPMETWLGSAGARKALAQVRSRQPEEVRHRPSANEAGGFGQKIRRKK